MAIATEQKSKLLSEQKFFKNKIRHIPLESFTPVPAQCSFSEDRLVFSIFFLFLICVICDICVSSEFGVNLQTKAKQKTKWSSDLTIFSPVMFIFCDRYCLQCTIHYQKPRKAYVTLNKYINEPNATTKFHQID